MTFGQNRPRSNVNAGVPMSTSTETEWLSNKIVGIARAWRIVLLIASTISIVGAVSVYLTRPPLSYTSEATLPLNPYLRGVLAQQGVAVTGELSPATGIHTVRIADRDPVVARGRLEKALSDLPVAWESSPPRQRQLAQSAILKSAIADLEGLRQGVQEAVKGSGASSDRIRSLLDIDNRIVDYRQKLLDIEGAAVRNENVIARPSLPAADPQPSLISRLLPIIAAALVLAIVSVGFYREIFPDGRTPPMSERGSLAAELDRK